MQNVTSNSDDRYVNAVVRSAEEYCGRCQRMHLSAGGSSGIERSWRQAGSYPIRWQIVHFLA
jgi:hypothetical protein